MGDLTTKQKILTIVGKPKGHYDFTELVDIASKLAVSQGGVAVENVSPLKTHPKIFKKGDVFRGSGVNSKLRPFVIAKKNKNGFYCIPLTTTKDEYALLETHSRFFRGYLGNYMVFVRKEFIESSFIGTLDDTRSLNKAIKVIADNFKKDFE